MPGCHHSDTERAKAIVDRLAQLPRHKQELFLIYLERLERQRSKESSMDSNPSIP